MQGDYGANVLPKKSGDQVVEQKKDEEEAEFQVAEHKKDEEEAGFQVAEHKKDEEEEEFAKELDFMMEQF